MNRSNDLSADEPSNASANSEQSELHRLKESNAELEQFAYNASHDLQDPLNNIASYLHLIRLQAGEDLDPRIKEYVENALASTETVKSLVRKLLEYSKVGNLDLTWEETTFSDLLAPVVLLFDSQIRERGATLELAKNETFVCDKFHYSLLFQNLIGNALKFVDAGKSPKIRLSVIKTDSHYEFMVADNGVGIPKDLREDVFKSFYRVGSQKVGGHGLGMAIVKKVVIKHGGQIRIEGNDEEGTTLRFTLPIRDLK